MTLVDTSIWIDHFRAAPPAASLRRLLADDDVLVHPWVIGELTLGSLGPQRDTILVSLRLLPRAPVVGDEDIMALVDSAELAGRGIGWVDAQLLGSARVAAARLWTTDKRLALAARDLGIA